MTKELTGVLTGEVHVDLPPDRAWVLFTPEGERRWVDHWDPQYPAGAVSEEVGTVFVTGPTTWIILDFEPGRRVRYARTTPGDRAGLVEVAFAPDETGTTATVTYALTALSADAAAELESFTAGYPAFLASWQRLIAASLGG